MFSFVGALLLILAFLGGLSFFGFHVLPAWLFKPLFFLTPAFGPVFLALAGLLAALRARSLTSVPFLRTIATFAFSALALLVPVAVLDLFLFGVIPYVGVFAVLLAVPPHLICWAALATGVFAARRAGTTPPALALALAAVLGLVAGAGLTVLRFAVVPRSGGIFLMTYAPDGSLVRGLSPLDAHGQKDAAETSGVQPREHHEPIAAIAENGLWLVRRGAGCSGLWLERRSWSRRTPEWQFCLEEPAGGVRNPTALALDAAGGGLLCGFDVTRDGREAWWLRRFDARGREDARFAKSTSEDVKVSRAYGARAAPDGTIWLFGESGEIDSRGTRGWLRHYAADGRELGEERDFPNAGEHRPTMAVVDVAPGSDGSLYVLLDLYGARSLLRYAAGDREAPDWSSPMPDKKDLTLAVDPKGGVLLFGSTGYAPQAWLGSVGVDGAIAWQRTLPMGDLSAVLAASFAADGDVFASGYGDSPDGKRSQWWLARLAPDGSRRPGWDRALDGLDNQAVPYVMRVDSLGRVWLLGRGGGWRFSGSALERWWGWN